MIATLANDGERVALTDNTRNLGHGLQIEVIYSDNSKGWEHEDDLIDREEDENITVKDEIFGNNGTFSEQIELQEYIQSKGVNLVHCNSCDGVFFHRNMLEVDTIVCPFCKVVTAPWDCQDYYYNGMFEQTEELNNK